MDASNYLLIQTVSTITRASCSVPAPMKALPSNDKSTSLSYSGPFAAESTFMNKSDLFQPNSTLNIAQKNGNCLYLTITKNGSKSSRKNSN